MEDNVRNCPNCGAPITTEICPYCKVMTGLDTKDADMEYPVMECKEAVLTFWNTIFPSIFAVSFGGVGILFLFVMGNIGVDAEDFNYSGFFFCLPFLLIGLIALLIIIMFLRRFFLVKFFGREIYATVYGYMDDNMLLNDSPAQIVKLLIDTSEGKKFILYQLNDTKKPYKINSNIELIVYKNYFLIKNKKDYFN